VNNPCHTVELKPRNSEVHSLELYHLATKQAEIYICVWRANPLKINAIAILLPSEFSLKLNKSERTNIWQRYYFCFVVICCILFTVEVELGSEEVNPARRCGARVEPRGWGVNEHTEGNSERDTGEARRSRMTAFLSICASCASFTMSSSMSMISFRWAPLRWRCSRWRRKQVCLREGEGVMGEGWRG